MLMYNEYLLQSGLVALLELIQRPIYTLRTSSNILVLRIDLIDPNHFAFISFFIKIKVMINYITINSFNVWFVT